MPRTSCEPQVNRPRTRRSARKENPYHNKKNQDKKEDVKEATDGNAHKTIDLSSCILCNTKISTEERRFLQDVQYHYTLCFFRQGKFKEIVPPINNDETKRQYICSQQGCSMREMRYKEYCIHEGIAHRKTLTLLSRDSVLKQVFAKLIELEIDSEIEKCL